ACRPRPRRAALAARAAPYGGSLRRRSTPLPDLVREGVVLHALAEALVEQRVRGAVPFVLLAIIHEAAAKRREGGDGGAIAIAEPCRQRIANARGRLRNAPRGDSDHEIARAVSGGGAAVPERGLAGDVHEAMRGVRLRRDATVHRAVARRGDDKLRVTDVAVGVRAARKAQARIRRGERAHLFTELRSDHAHERSGAEQRARLASGNRASAHNERLDHVAVQHERKLAHKNSPARGPIARNATYSAMTMKKALDQIAARADCHPATTRPTVSAVIAPHAAIPQMTLRWSASR